MLLERKLRQPSPGQPKQPLTRLKELPPEERDAVMGILESNSYEQARALVEARVGIACSVDTLGRFFAWKSAQKTMAHSDEMLGEVEDFIAEHYQGWSEEKMREAASAFFMARTMEKRDAKSFACVAKLGLDSRRERNEAEKLVFEKQ